MSQDINVIFENYPIDGGKSDTREVTFGPEGDDKTRILIEMTEDASEVTFTVGNGPPDFAMVATLPDILETLAELVEDAAGTDAFQAALDEASSALGE